MCNQMRKSVPCCSFRSTSRVRKYEFQPSAHSAGDQRRHGKHGRGVNANRRKRQHQRNGTLGDGLLGDKLGVGAQLSTGVMIRLAAASPVKRVTQRVLQDAKVPVLSHLEGVC